MVLALSVLFASSMPNRLAKSYFYALDILKWAVGSFGFSEKPWQCCVLSIITSSSRMEFYDFIDLIDFIDFYVRIYRFWLFDFGFWVLNYCFTYKTTSERSCFSVFPSFDTDSYYRVSLSCSSLSSSNNLSSFLLRVYQPCLSTRCVSIL